MPKAGPDKQLCGAQRLSQPEGVTCTQRAGWGTDHPGVGRCKRHGGATSSHREHASTELARRECDRLGIPIQVDPGEALVQELWETAGNVAFYRALVQDLPTHPGDDKFIPDGDDSHWERGEPGVYGRTYHVSGIPTGEAKPHILVTLYNDERKHLAAVAASALKAGVEQRRVAVAEQQGQVIADVLRGVLTELGVIDKPDVPSIVRRHLALVATST